MVITRPTFKEEQFLWDSGFKYVAGVDEAGRGPLAGPVVASAVILPVGLQAKWCSLVADSKLVTELRREKLYDCITKDAVSFGTGVVDARTIDMVGIAKASRLAMKSAVKRLEPAAEYLLIDFFRLPEVRMKQKGVIEGDTLCFSIACASIIAKVTRDRLMVELDKEYPGYRLADHKGYSTKAHQDCLRRLGPSPIHRMSFRPVREQVGEPEE
jgi:ribonuclease HII